MGSSQHDRTACQASVPVHTQIEQELICHWIQSLATAYTVGEGSRYVTKVYAMGPGGCQSHIFCSVSKDITVLKYNYDLHLVPYYFCRVCSEEDWKSQIRRPPADQRYRRLDRIPL